MKHGRLASEVPKGFFRAVFGVPRMRASVCSVVTLQYAFPLNPLKSQSFVSNTAITRHGPFPTRRHGIVPLRAERMASQDPPQPDKSPLHRTMHFQRFDHVVRAARSETATVPKEWTEHNLIRPHEEYQRCRHDARDARRAISSITSRHLLPFKAARPMNIHSVFSGIEPSFTRSRYASLRSRFALFLSTAS